MEQVDLCGLTVHGGGISEAFSLGEAAPRTGREVGIVVHMASRAWQSEKLRFRGIMHFGEDRLGAFIAPNIRAALPADVDAYNFFPQTSPPPEKIHRGLFMFVQCG